MEQFIIAAIERVYIFFYLTVIATLVSNAIAADIELRTNKSKRLQRTILYNLYNRVNSAVGSVVKYILYGPPSDPHCALLSNEQSFARNRKSRKTTAVHRLHDTLIALIIHGAQASS